MVGLTKETNPFDGIGDGVIEGAVVAIELAMRLAAAVDEAVTALNRLACLAEPSSRSECLHISPVFPSTLAKAGDSQLYPKEQFDLTLHGARYWRVAITPFALPKHPRLTAPWSCNLNTFRQVVCVNRKFEPTTRQRTCNTRSRTAVLLLLA